MKKQDSVFYKIAGYQVLAMFRRGLFYSFLSIYLRYYLGLSVTVTTFYSTFPMLFNILTQNLLWGRLSDRFQLRRSLIVTGELLAAFGTVVVWILHVSAGSKLGAGWVIIIGLTIVEAFWSMSNVGWTSLISDLYPDRDRTRVQGFLTSLGGVGRMAGVIIGGYAYDNGAGFANGFLFIISAVVMVVSTIPLFFVPEGGAAYRAERLRKAAPVETGGLETPTQPEQPKPSNVQFARVPFFLFLSALILINFGRNSVSTVYSQYLVLDTGFHISAITLSYIVNMFSVGMFLFGFSMGFLVKKFSDEFLMVTGSLCALVYLLGTGLAPSVPWFFLFSLFSGFGEVLIASASYSITARLIPPERRGRMFALYNATFFLSWGIGGTLIAGPLTDSLIHAGKTAVFAYKSAFFCGAAVLIAGVALLIFFFGSRHHTREKRLA